MPGIKVKIPTRIGPCYPRCTPTYGPGGSGSRSHRLVNGVFPGAAPPVPDWWDPNDEGLCVFAAYQAKGAADLAASYIDLTGNGRNCGPGVAPTWDAVNGWKFNGIAQYLDTGFPASSGTWSFLCQFTNYTSGAGSFALFGAYTTAGNNNFIYPHNATNQVHYFYGTGAGRLAVGPQLATGNLGMSGNVGGFRNGVSDGALAGCAHSTHDIFIGCLNNAGAAAQFAAVYIQAWVAYNCALTAPQVAAVAAAMAAL